MVYGRRINEFLYVRVSESAVNTDKKITFELKSYIGTSLAQELQTKLTAAFTQTLTVTYSSSNGTLNFVISSGSFRIYTMSEIENGVVTWTGTGFDTYVGKSAEELLRLDTMGTNFVNWHSNFIDLLNVHSLYLTSDNLGNFESLGPRGNRNIIKKTFFI